MKELITSYSILFAMMVGANFIGSALFVGMACFIEHLREKKNGQGVSQKNNRR